MASVERQEALRIASSYRAVSINSLENDDSLRDLREKRQERMLRCLHDKVGKNDDITMHEDRGRRYHRVFGLRSL